MGELPITTAVSEGLIRLPLWVGMSDEQIDYVIGAVSNAILATP
jgi:dTDP-4-amino-4,6-dideoxygalactose transaminase